MKIKIFESYNNTIVIARLIITTLLEMCQFMNVITLLDIGAPNLLPRLVFQLVDSGVKP